MSAAQAPMFPGTYQTNLIDYGQKMANPAFNLMNPLDIPYGGSPSDVSRRLKLATNDVMIQGQVGRPAYTVNEINNRNAVPDSAESRLAKAVKLCEAVQTVDCNRFKSDPEFAKTCMMTHGVARNSTGQNTIGGRVLYEEDRESQIAAVRAKGGSGRYVNYTPTIGEASKDKMSASYDQCIAMEEKIKCETQGDVSLPNCGVCQDGRGKYYRIDPAARRVGPSLNVVGQGILNIVSQSQPQAQANLNLTQSPQQIPLPAGSEGGNFIISITGTPANPPKIAGFLQGPNSNGITRLDLAFVCPREFIQGSEPPIIGGSTEIDGEGVSILTIDSSLMPSSGSGPAPEVKMNLKLEIPFTFLDSSEEEASVCPGAAYSTKAASLKLFADDPCYNPNTPGQHSVACLQKRWRMAGCSAQGTGYPRSESDENASKLRYVNGQPQTLGQIGNKIYKSSIEAKTGMRNGQKMSIQDWDDVSKYCLGTRIRTPCSGPNQMNGPLTDECIQYLYENRGDRTLPGNQYGEGRTYTRREYGSASPSGPHCTREGTAAPYTPENLAMAKSKGGVIGVQRYFDEIQQRAQDNSLSDNDRKDAVKKCYGIDFVPDPNITSQNPLNIKGNISLQPHNNDKFIRHQGFVMWHHPNDGSTLFKNDASFKASPPLCGKPGYMSMESVNYPGYYVINEGGRAKIVPREQTPEYESRACWQPTMGQNNFITGKTITSGVGCGLPGFIGFENAYTPGSYLRAGPNNIADIYIPKTEQDRNDTCFRPRSALIQ